MKVAIIGSGPAGLFCADRLASQHDVTIFETGLPIGDRVCPENRCKTCKICHVLEGEGGAGGLSDGKNTYSITRGTQMESIFQDEDSQWLKYIDQYMVRFGGEGVWYNPLTEQPPEFEGSPLQFDSYPLRHIGSDGIRRFVRHFVFDLRRRGVEIITNMRAQPLLEDDNSAVRGVEVDNDNHLFTFDQVVIAAGLQGIPWIEQFMIDARSPLGSGPAGFGIRLEFNAEITKPLHDQFYDYKIIYEHPGSGLILRSFCCNQFGLVINEDHNSMGVINVNGHSFLEPSLRTKSSNMALIAKIPEGFRDPQAFVRNIARLINHRAGGSAYQPLIEFMKDDDELPEFDHKFMTNPQSMWADISKIIGQYNPSLLQSFRKYIIELNKIVDIIIPTSVVYAPEIKYYGRRVNVDNNWKSKDIERLYVIGSGSGHIDSFVAAALSGIVAAENIKKGGN